jgi:DNA-directed RNA polymerase subunit M/transcription elongation factor TFIIS
MPEECPECKKIALITYRDGTDGFKKCKECGYQKELPPESEANSGCGCC